MNIERLPNEGYLDYARRLTESVDDGLLNWQQWSAALLGKDIYGEENCRRNGVFFKKFLEKCVDEYENSFEKCDDLSQKSYEKCDESQIALRDEIIKERKKLQTVNLELQEKYRIKARSELLDERIINSIKHLNSIEVKSECRVKKGLGKTGLLLISDIHAGSTYEIHGLKGDMINIYNNDVLVDRMEQIIGDLEEEWTKMECDSLVIACLGDFFENLLRPSSLQKLREPVVDTVIWFSEFYARWIAKVREICCCPVEVVTIGGNHDMQRYLTSKPDYDNENLGKLIQAFIKIRLADIPDITIRDYSEFDVMNICDVHVAFCHGTDKDMAATMDYFSNVYRTDIDICYAGHLHGNSVGTNGFGPMGDREFIRIGSICGCDLFSHKIRKASRPSYYMAVFGDGKEWERKFYLR